jgi:hypothetical protein
MFSVYKNQLSRLTGSRNLTGPKTLPTIWYTYMTLVTQYQISAINSYWEKCDEIFFAMYKKKTTTNLKGTSCSPLCKILVYKTNIKHGKMSLYPRSLKGEGGILFYLCPSVLFFSTFFINIMWKKYWNLNNIVFSLLTRWTVG